MDGKAHCRDCALAQPRDDVAEVDPRDWVWPEDYECEMDGECYPHLAHMCVDFVVKGR